MSWFAYHQTPEGHFLERFGLDFEDFAAGQRFVHRPGMTVTQQDNAMESLDTVNAAMVHYDAHYSAQTSWKLPLVVSTITLQALIGMSSKTFARRQRISRFDTIAMTAPVFGGDTLYAESEVLATRDDGASDIGEVQVLGQVLNATGQVVAKVTYVTRIYKRGQGPVQAPPHLGTLMPTQDERFRSHRQDAQGRYVEQTGLFYEQFKPGETFLHWPRRTLTAQEGMVKAWRSMNWHPDHHDLAWAHGLGMDQVNLPQAWVVSVATAMTTRTFGRVVANLGWTDVQMHRDLPAGETLRSQSIVLEARASSSRPNEGILTVRTEAYDEAQRLVLGYGRNLLVYKASAPSPYEAAGY